MADIFLDSLIDTLKLLPWLLLLYIVIELIEHKTDFTGRNNRLNGKLGVLIGSATGLIPQCGFSVMAAKLFSQKYITVGTLLAIFISTSDEAFIILLSSGESAVWLLPLIALKIFAGVVVGYAVDGIISLIRHRQVCVESTSGANLDAAKEENAQSARELFLSHEEERRRVENEPHFECTSCGRTHFAGKPWKTYFLSPLVHSLKVAFFIFVVNFFLGMIINWVTEEKFQAFMNGNLFLQPVISSLVGLIPNCASSVVITQSFLQGGISFGSCAAGLCANAGLGFVVLLKDVKKWRRNLALIVVCYAVSVVIGLSINALSLLF